MNVLSRMSLFALAPLVSSACKAAGLSALGEGAATVTRFITDRISDQSLRVVEALANASNQAWRTLEVALAGESVANALDRADDKAFREQIRLFLLSAQFDGRAASDRDFVVRCLAELRVARANGSLAGEVDPSKFGDLTRFADPAGLLDAEWKVADELAADLQARGFTTLAVFLTLRPASDPNAVPLLAVAVRHHFRRTVEDDPKLFQGLAFAQLERIGKVQEQNAAQLAEQLARIEGRLGELHTSLGAGRKEPEAPPREKTRPVIAEDQTNGPVAVSPDGKVAVCGSPYDGKLRVFDVASGKELRRLAGHSSWVTCVAFTMDGRRVVSGGQDGNVKLWDMSTGRLLRTYGHVGTVPVAVEFSSNGKTAMSTGADGTVRTWNVV